MDKVKEYLNEKGLDISDFDDDQIEQIRLGLAAELDVSRYADLKYKWEQMQQIRIGLEDELDVSMYADPKFNVAQMQEIRLELMENKKNVEELKKREVDKDKEEKIMNANKENKRQFVNTLVNKKLVFKHDNYYSIIVPDKTTVDDLDISGRVYHVNEKFVREYPNSEKYYSVGFAADFEVSLHKEDEESIKLQAKKLVLALKDSYEKFKANSLKADKTVSNETYEKMLSNESKAEISSMKIIEDAAVMLLDLHKELDIDMRAEKCIETFKNDTTLKEMYFNENYTHLIEKVIPNLNEHELLEYKNAKDKKEYFYLAHVNNVVSYELHQMDRRGEIELSDEQRKQNKKTYENKIEYDVLEF